MKYVKKLALYSKSPMDDRFSVLQDSRIVTNSSSTMQLPTGPSVSRPTTLVDGTVRYNSTIKEFEVYNSANPGFTSPWQIISCLVLCNDFDVLEFIGGLHRTIFYGASSLCDARWLYHGAT